MSPAPRCFVLVSPGARPGPPDVSDVFSFFPTSTNPQVLMMMASDSSWSSTTSKPLAKRSPSITSPSTVFLGQPSDTMDTLARSAAASASSSSSSVAPPSGGGARDADDGDEERRPWRGDRAAAETKDETRGFFLDVRDEAPDEGAAASWAARLPREAAADMVMPPK